MIETIPFFSLPTRLRAWILKNNYHGCSIVLVVLSDMVSVVVVVLVMIV